MSEAEQDLDIAIGQYAELLASNLHAQRAAHFPPDAKKVMRTLTSGEAAELLGVDHTYLRKLHREGKIADVETTAGSHRRYTLDDIWEIRHALEANAKKPGTYVPGRRAGDELQIVSVVNFKGGSGKTTTSAHLAQRLALKGYRVLAIDLDPQASLSALHGIQPELDLMEGGTLYDAVRYDEPVPISDVIRKTYIRGLDLIPGNLELMEFEHETPAAIQRGGARAFFARVRDALDSVEADYDVVVIGSPNVNPGFQLVKNKAYPRIAEDFNRTFKVLNSLKCDYFLGAHGNYYGMHAKYPRQKAGAKVSPFIDPAGYRDYIELKEKAFRDKLAAQKKASR